MQYLLHYHCLKIGIGELFVHIGAAYILRVFYFITIYFWDEIAHILTIIGVGAIAVIYFKHFRVHFVRTYFNSIRHFHPFSEVVQVKVKVR